MAVTRTSAQILVAAATLAALAGAASNSDNKASTLQDLRYTFERARSTYVREVSAAPLKTASGTNEAALWTAASITDGMVWRAATTGDTTNTALATAKGSALVALVDVFQRVGTAVVYVGPVGDVTGLDAALKG